MDVLSDLEHRLQHDKAFRQQWEEDAPEREILSAIAQLRCEQGLSQKELAQKTGLKQGEISKIENGKTNPTLSTLVKIAKGLGMRLELQFKVD